jgi:hypothetical protein
MKSALYYSGRALQLFALFTMPSSIWVGWIKHDEAGCIVLFLGSIAVFYTGYLLTQWALRL